MTQQGFLRLASNPSVFNNDSLTLTEAWQGDSLGPLTIWCDPLQQRFVGVPYFPSGKPIDSKGPIGNPFNLTHCKTIAPAIPSSRDFIRFIRAILRQLRWKPWGTVPQFLCIADSCLKFDSQW